jgi:simple sugar transport system permease protein
MTRFRLERRLDAKPWLSFAVPVLSVLGALVSGGMFFALTGRPPGTVYSKMFDAAFGSVDGITDTLATSAPLILTGLAAAFAMRMGLYNIGGEGQLYAGAIASSGAALVWANDQPSVIAIGIVFIAGAVGGMVWVLIPAMARAFTGTSEIITTLMMVFVADKVLDYLISGSQSYWRDPLTIGFPQGKEIPDVAQFDRWFDNSRITIALPVALVMVGVLWFVWARTSFGYSMKVIGDAPLAARYAGIPQRRTIIVTLLVSGALAGMAGAAEIGSRAYRLDPAGLRLSLGFTGIVIAALARRNPFGVALVAVLLGGLQNAGQSVQTISGVDVPKSVSLMLQGAILLFVLGGDVFRSYRLTVVRRTSAVEGAVS